MQHFSRVLIPYLLVSEIEELLSLIFCIRKVESNGVAHGFVSLCNQTDNGCPS